MTHLDPPWLQNATTLRLRLAPLRRTGDSTRRLKAMIEYTSLTDTDLAQRILASPPGEARAEEAELCGRFARRVRLYGLRHLRDEQAADDLVQRVLLLTLEKLRAREVREPARIASFVLGVARMTARNMARARGREELMPDESLAQLPGPEARAPEPLAAELLAECLQSLSERERAVVLLTFYQEQRAAEAAKKLSITEGNLRVIRHRAVGRLRDCMGLSEDVLP